MTFRLYLDTTPDHFQLTVKAFTRRYTDVSRSRVEDVTTTAYERLWPAPYDLALISARTFDVAASYGTRTVHVAADASRDLVEVLHAMNLGVRRKNIEKTWR